MSTGIPRQNSTVSTSTKTAMGKEPNFVTSSDDKAGPAAHKRPPEDGQLKMPRVESSNDGDNKVTDMHDGKRSSLKPTTDHDLPTKNESNHRVAEARRSRERSRSPTRSKSPRPRRLSPRQLSSRRLSPRRSRSPGPRESRRYRIKSRSPEFYRDRDRYRYDRDRDFPRDRYRDRTPDRYSRRGDYGRRRRSRSPSRERGYSRRYRSPSPKRSRRSYHSDLDNGRDSYYHSSSRRRYRSRSRSRSRSRDRSRSPGPSRRTSDGPPASYQPSQGSTTPPAAGPVNAAQKQAGSAPVGSVYSASVHQGVVQQPGYLAPTAPFQASYGLNPNVQMMVPPQQSLRYSTPQSNQVITKSRRLYVGNIPFHAGISENALVQFFNALHMAGFGPSTTTDLPPVLSVWLHQDGKFGFMETRSDQEAVNVMQFNGVSLHGRPLRINRPSDYNPAIHNPSAAMLVPDPMNYAAVVELCGKLGGIAGPPPPPPPTLISSKTSTGEVSKADTLSPGKPRESLPTAIAARPSPPEEPVKANPPPSIPSPPRNLPMLRSAPAPSLPTANGRNVVALKNIIQSPDLDGSERNYQDLLSDVREECAQHGRVTSILIPRTGAARGTAFIGFSNESEAKLAVKKLGERVFDGQAVRANIEPGVSSASEAVRRIEDMATSK